MEESGHARAHEQMLIIDSFLAAQLIAKMIASTLN
jgi:hypothetical protein